MTASTIGFCAGSRAGRDFIESLFRMIEMTEAKTLTDLKNVKGARLPKNCTQ